MDGNGPLRSGTDTANGVRFVVSDVEDLDIRQAFPENTGRDAEARLLELAGESIKIARPETMLK